jgi:hypothetical protein
LQGRLLVCPPKQFLLDLDLSAEHGQALVHYAE